MTARDVVPQPAEPRGFLRRRKTDEPYPHHPVVPVEPAVEVIEAPVEAVVAEPEPIAEPVTDALPVVAAPVDESSDLDHLWALEDLAVAPSSCAQCADRTESEELFRAQASLLSAALRQADELEAALTNEQHERREETARLVADNELLRNALATLNAEALNRQQPVEAPLPRDPFSRMVPEQREHGSPLLRPVVEEPVTSEGINAIPQQSDPSSSRSGRRRSGREAGPA